MIPLTPSVWSVRGAKYRFDSADIALFGTEWGRSALPRNSSKFRKSPSISIKFRLVEFEEVNDAYEWFAKIEQLPKETAVVNRNNVQLNHTLSTWTNPACTLR